MANPAEWNTGTLKGAKVLAASPIDGDKCLVLLDADSGKESTAGNLLCIDRSGSVEWRAELPGHHDSFVEFENTPAGLFAWTLSCWRLKLDVSTGRVIERTFVK